VATKEHKRHAKGLIEGLETRLHVGPPVRVNEVVSVREFLQQSDFSPSSDYFTRLTQIQYRLQTRSTEPTQASAKRNYGGEAAGHWMQLQSAYDHVILSICYEGELNWKQGRVKISHRFNQQGRIDFVELKFLRSLEPILNGGLRKLVTVKNYQNLVKDWNCAEAFVLPILPRELVFLYSDIFHSERNALLAWLINIGHGFVDDLMKDLKSSHPNGHVLSSKSNENQLCLQAVRTDEVAIPILEKAARLKSAVDIVDAKSVVIRY
jgi:hypothetical protein